MKANQKFLRGDDEAVSPVIAVILMVAITVVLAATVYVWVSGFGGGGTASKAISLSSPGPISGGVKTLTVSSATSGMTWGDIIVTLDGATLTIDTTACTSNPASATVYQPCGPTIETSSGQVNAGNTIKFLATSGQKVSINDANANSVLASMTVN